MKYLILILSLISVLTRVNSQELKTFSIYFDNNAAILKIEEQKKLDAFISEQSKLNTIIKYLDGYTDSVGTEKSNLILAKRRIDFVLKQLPKNQLKVISTRTFGEKYPSSIDSKTIELSKLRKVEITYYFTEQPQPIKEEPSYPDTKEIVNLAKFRENFTSETPVVLDVKFYGGTANLIPGSEDEINALYKFLAGNKNVSALIRGHVCCHDDMPLSVQRANAVYDILIRGGIEPSRLDFKGYSNTQPVISPEYTEEERQQNRRVDVVFSIQK
jgi:outer membrane protein OmpA-like peptidoglycan-associated protein